MLELITAVLNSIAKLRISGGKNIMIHPTAKVNYRGIRVKRNNNVTVGAGSIVEGSILFDKDNASISIGQNSFIGGSALVSAERIEIGNDVLIAWGCWVVDHNSHSVIWRQRSNDVKDWYHGKKDWTNISRAKIVIADKAWIGFNSIILKGVTIGEGSVIGAGSVVTKDVPPYTVVAGNPARVIRAIPPEER